MKMPVTIVGTPFRTSSVKRTGTHLYGAHLASGGAVLPPHEVVVFDEAHEVEEVMTDSLGVEIGPGRFRALAATARPLVEATGPGGLAAVDAVAEVGDLLHRVLRPLAGRRVSRPTLVGAGGPGGAAPPDPDPSLAEPLGLELGLEAPAPGPRRTPPDPVPSGDPELDQVVALANGRVGRLIDHLRQAERVAGDDGPQSDRSRRDRALLAAGHLAADLARLYSLGDDAVAWVDGGSRSPSLRISPIEVGPLLTEQLWGSVTGVLTSATVPLGLPERLGLPAGRTDELDVGSPFEYRRKALLYVAQSLPDRRSPEAEPALHDELEVLIGAAGGRTLALFTSWRAMHAAVLALRDRVGVPILAQSDLPKPALVEAFRADEATCLFATLGYWQGVDVPGPTLSLVTVDRIRSPVPTTRCWRPWERAGSGRSARSTCPGPAHCWPRVRDA